MVKDRETVIRDLNSIEDRFHAANWKIGDIHYWPLIKTSLFFSWHRRYLNANHVPKKALNTKPRLSYVSRFIIKLKSVFAWIVFYLSGFRYKTDVIFSGYWAHRVSFNGDYINRYFDPLIKLIDQRYIFIEYGSKHEYSAKPKYDRLETLHQYIPMMRLIGSLYFRHLRLKIEQDVPIATLSELFSISKETLLRLITREICAVQGYSIWFGVLIKRTQPKAVFGLCYYTASMYGLNLAAARLGVPSVDMQHGGQGQLHPSYSGFLSVPQGGYRLLPRFFWLWNSESRHAIDKWAHNSFHRTIVGGNPWNILAVKGGILDSYKLKMLDKRVILYTMQYPLLDELISNTINNTKDQVFWMIRIHPRMLEFKAAILAQIGELGLTDYVDVESATSFPLPQLLMQSDVHVSYFSGSIIEAYELGVPNVIIGQVGATMYQDLGENCNNYFVPDGKSHLELSALILRIHSTRYRAPDMSKMEELAVQSYRQIANGN